MKMLDFPLKLAPCQVKPPQAFSGIISFLSGSVILQLTLIWEKILEGGSQVKEVKLGKVLLAVHQINNLSLSKCRWCPPCSALSNPGLRNLLGWSCQADGRGVRAGGGWADPGSEPAMGARPARQQLSSKGRHFEFHHHRQHFANVAQQAVICRQSK
jgi:hypothetical protein